MSKPCRHATTVSGCRLSELDATDERYRALFRDTAKLSEPAAPRAESDPTRHVLRLVLWFPERNASRRVTLVNSRARGVWRADVTDDVSASLQRNAEGRWVLSLARGATEEEFAPVTETAKPWELTFWVPAGWFGPACEVFVTAR